ncbi:MAG TPA: glycosyltransferase family 9 protein [Thermoanaerobaculia bacterium]
MTKLLVVRLSALGDVIHTIPAVVALRERYDDIAWAVETPYRELVEIVAKVKAIPVSLKKWSLTNVNDARKNVRGFDVAIDFQGLIKSALLARVSGAKERIGFAQKHIKEKPAAWFLTREVNIDASKHVVDWNLQLAGVTTMPEVDFAPFATGELDSGGAVILLPGAGRPEKIWPAERFRALAQRLGDRALVVWGPGEEERARAIGARMTPKTSLRELAKLLKTASLVIGGDTGPLHLADALGTKVIGLHGPTNPRRNGPYSQLHRCISTYGTTKRMESIEVDDVLAMIE